MKPAIPTTYPSWLPKRAVTYMNKILQECFRAAGCTRPVNFHYLNEQDVLARQHLPASSLLYCPTSSYNNLHTLTCILTGLDARNHKTRLTLTSTAEQADLLRRFLLSQPNKLFILTTPASLESSNPTPETADPATQTEVKPVFDDTDRALFLADVLAAGHQITTATAKALVLRLFGKAELTHELITNCIAGGWLQQEGSVLSLTASGESFIANASAPPPPPPQAPTFPELRARVIAAREACAALESRHTAEKAQRQELEARLEKHRRTYTAGTATLEKLRQQIAELETAHTETRRAILALEEQHRALPPDLSPQLIQAQRDLQEAEAAYTDFIKIS